jgi:thioester reductase-like protein
MIIHAFRERVRQTPAHAVLTFVDETGADAAAFTFSTLDRASDAQASFLTGTCGLRAGDRALLVYAPGLDVLVTFLGCLKAGIVPVPVPPPNPFNLQNDLALLGAVAASADAKAILSHSVYAQERLLATVGALAADTGSPLAQLPWHRTDEAPPVEAPFEAVDPADGDVAFLLYTSGSTSLPKGVTVTHGNLRHQLEANRIDLAMGDDARFVSWLPHYHGFSLVNGFLSAVSGNGALWQLSPLAFVQRPARWFDVASRVRATHTAAPNFAYALALKATSAEERASWDLASVRVMMSAAEPIHLPTMAAFFAAFEVAKLSPSAFCPAYGLSEHTVGVTVNGTGHVVADRDELEARGRVREVAESGRSVSLVGCGRPLRGVELRIVSPESSEVLGEREVGEIWVHSDSVAGGYWGLPEETEATFGGRLPDDDRSWLRTGDLGFLRDEQLFVTGRLKDLIIVRGRNLYPNDVELAAHAATPALRPGDVVAFGVPDPAAEGEERIAVVAEADPETMSDEEAAAAIAAVRQRILQEFHVPCGTVALVRPGAILRTPNGKIRRQPTRTAFLAGLLAEATWTGETEHAAVEVSIPKRVCVIGGGISGVTAAYELTRLGHHVTLLEQQPFVGGKCESIEVDGHWFDLGGHMMSVRYVVTQALMREVGVEIENTTAAAVYSLERRSAIAHDMSVFTRESWQHYQDLRRVVFPDILKPGFANVGAQLADPIAKWTRRNGLEALPRSLAPHYTGAGYGYVADPTIPAMYFVKKAEIMAYLTLGNYVTTNAAGSTHEFVLRMAREVADVRTGIDVRRIERGPDGVRVAFDDEELQFDELVLALPLERSLPFLDATPEERDLFGRIRYLDYCTTVATARGLPRKSLFLVKETSLDRDRVGEIVSFHHRYDNSDVYLFWSYGDDLDEVARKVGEGVERMGGVVEKIHAVRAWKYMPHVSPDDLDDGFFERLEALQGTKRTHYVGTLLNFELMEGATSYAWELVRTQFAPARAGLEPRPSHEELLRRAGVLDVGAETHDGHHTETEVADWLRERFARALELAPADVDATRPVAEYAVDSLTATSILGDLAAWLGFQIAPSLFLEAPTLADAARFLVTGEAVASAPADDDLAARATLDPAVRAGDLPVADTTSPRAVLLTGATGFLGAFLTRELVRRTDAAIHCLVRAPDADAGMQRLRRNLEHFELWDPAMAERLHPVVGDLGAEGLGLSNETIATLSQQLDAIYHNGASVNWVYTFEQLEAANVRPLHTLLRIATTSRLKALHYVSSIGVLLPPTPVPKDLLEEDDDLDLYRGHLMGYVQTKWVAEKLLAEARARGVPVTVIRPPLIGGAGDNGAYKTENDFVAVSMKGCIQMGTAPDTWGEAQLLPVDYVAETIVELSKLPQAVGRTFNLVHGVRWDEVVAAIRDFGYPVATIPHDEWIGRIGEVGPENALYALKYLFTTKLWGTESTFADLYLPKVRRERIDDRNVRALLGEDWPERIPATETLIQTWLEYFTRTGFTAAPAPARV